MQVVWPGQDRMAHIGVRTDRLLSGRSISLLVAANSMITVVTLFSSRNLGPLKRLPVSAGLHSSPDPNQVHNRSGIYKLRSGLRPA